MNIVQVLLLACVLASSAITATFANDLKTYQGKYVEALKRIHSNVNTSQDALNDDYAGWVKTLGENAQRDGDLEKVKAALAESSRFANAKAVFKVSADDAGGSFRELKKAQLAYIEKGVALHRNEAEQIVSLAEKYDRVLAQLQTDLTKAGKIDDATAVQLERKRTEGSFEVSNAKSILKTGTQSRATNDAPTKALPDSSQSAKPTKRTGPPKPAKSISDSWIRSCVVVSLLENFANASAICGGHKVSYRKNYFWASQVDDKMGVAILHPLSADQPASLTYTPNTPLKIGDEVKITMRGSAVKPGGVLKAYVNEKLLQEESFDSEWITVEVPIDADTGGAKSIRFEFWPVAWSFEFSYIDAIEVIRGGM